MQVVKNELQTKTLKKTIFTLLFILSLNSIFAFGTNDTLQLKNEFKELTIRYQYGDESYTIEEMKFVKKGNRIIAIISIPDNQLLENSETKIEILRGLIKEGEESGIAEYSYDNFISELDAEYDV